MKIQCGFDDRVPASKAVPWALQYLFTIFTGSMTGSIMLASGAGLDTADTAFMIQCGLMGCGITTLIQSLGIHFGKFKIGGRLPLVSSGSWTLATSMILFANDPQIGIAGAFGASLIGAVFLFLMGPFVIEKLYQFFRPAVTGSVVLATGLCLVLTAWKDMVDFNPQSPDALKMLLIGLGIAALCLLIDCFGKGVIQSLSVLIAMVLGFAACALTGMIDFSSVGSAAWVSLPKPAAYGLSFQLGAVITMCIIQIATIMGDYGNITSIVTAAGESLPSKDTLKASVRGDAVGSIFSSLFNSLPMCVAAQTSGVVIMTGVASRFVTAAAGAMFMVLAVIPKFSQVLALIPNPVIGGILLVTFGNIMASGIKIIGFDKNTKRNMTIVAMALAIGVGGNSAQSSGMLSFVPSTALALFTGIPGTAVAALIFNMILPGRKEDN